MAERVAGRQAHFERADRVEVRVELLLIGWRHLRAQLTDFGFDEIDDALALFGGRVRYLGEQGFEQRARIFLRLQRAGGAANDRPGCGRVAAATKAGLDRPQRCRRLQLIDQEHIDRRPVSPLREAIGTARAAGPQRAHALGVTDMRRLHPNLEIG